MKSLIWFRRDLRVTDNTALFYAAAQATDGVIALYVVTPTQWKQHDDAACKVRFWLDNLQSLSDSLGKIRIPLLIKTCETFQDVPQIVVSVAKQHQCSTLFLNREYEFNEARRDLAVVKECHTAKIAVRQFHDRVIVPPREISTKEGRFYSVFTPYKKVWNTKAHASLQSFSIPARQPPCTVASSAIPTRISGFDFSESHRARFPAGEPEAMMRLKNFAKKITHYHQHRDFPSIHGTSQISPYLAAGIISPRQCLQAALNVNDGQIDGGHEGVRTWISELTWRDFYTHVMVGYPRVSKHQPFKLKTNSIDWRTNEADFDAWKTGGTGYPIVDAGMRQLNQTGWMHNRLRMVTAMFLTKHLLIDWRMGERYFMQRLIDGDLAANNGGWQWSASTGTDSVPYFRIFNPFSQSKRFDPDGQFIKQFCPELNSVPTSALHDARKLTQAIEGLKLTYPGYVVDYHVGRQRALSAFKESG